MPLDELQRLEAVADPEPPAAALRLGARQRVAQRADVGVAAQVPALGRRQADARGVREARRVACW